MAAVLGRSVVNQTGLTARYDFKLQWTPDTSQTVRTADDEPPMDNASAPSIFAAIEEQLVLKLEVQRGSVEIVVIDHVERPSAN